VFPDTEEEQQNFTSLLVLRTNLIYNASGGSGPISIIRTKLIRN
jgi:hypothetical protein